MLKVNQPLPPLGHLESIITDCINKMRLLKEEEEFLDVQERMKSGDFCHVTVVVLVRPAVTL